MTDRQKWITFMGNLIAIKGMAEESPDRDVIFLKIIAVLMALVEDKINETGRGDKQ